MTALLTAPKRIQRQRTKGWRMPSDAIYCGRPTIYGNPWKVARYITPAECVKRYRLALMGGNFWATAILEMHLSRFHVGPPYDVAQPDFEFFRNVFIHETLRGRDLACWCKLDQPCHVDVLLEIANR